MFFLHSKSEIANSIQCWKCCQRVCERNLIRRNFSGVTRLKTGRAESFRQTTNEFVSIETKDVQEERGGGKSLTKQTFGKQFLFSP